MVCTKQKKDEPMKSYKLILAAALLIATIASAQVKTSYFPTEMKLLAHIDMKRLVSSKTGDLILGSMDEKSQRKMDSLTALSGIEMKKDLDSLYILSTGEGENSGLVYATGRFDINKLTTILGGNDGFKSEAFGSNKILTWVDDGDAHYGSFVNNGLVIASDNIDQLKKSLSLVQGKGQPLSPDSPLAKIIPGKKNRFLSLAAYDVGGLADAAPQMQMLKEAKSVFFSIDQATADKADVILNAAVSAANLEAAQQMSAMIQGIQAMMMMQAAQNPEIAQLAQNFKVVTKDTKIKMSLKLSEQQLKKQIANGMKKANAANAAEPQPNDE